ncbi:MAG: protein translocase subunit SecD [Actinobacteria bacterium]|nr:protein translocase subunit SecD [Actinomycetota bacterium]
MAAPQAQLRAGRYFLALLVLVTLLYGLVFLTGSTRTPKLGLDLRGGTTVTLVAKTSDGKTPGSDAMNTAREIIQSRVNGRGIASAEVVIEGTSNIVISVPGDNGEQAKQLGSTALLRFRPVLQVFPVAGVTSPPPTPSAPTPSAPSPTASGAAGTATPRPTPSVTPKTSVTPKVSVSPKPTPASSGSPVPTSPEQLYPGATPDQLRMLTGLNCKAQQAVIDNPAQEIAACSTDGLYKYVLDKVIGEGVPGKTPLEGTQIANAQAQYDTQNLQGWVVLLDFRSAGQTTWAEYTAANVGKNVAFTLDGKVVSAPTIQGAINGQTQITGNFDESSAKDLANSLKYGALPLAFTQANAQTVSPTLGTDQMRAGLLAGGIGLLLVVIYTLLYYRALGLVTITSLLVSGMLTYAGLVLLGRQIGFTLTLAGIAGFIVAVGITADSFVVFFERLKDEVREGRTGRSAVPRAWVRARRTILSADAVSFLAAAVLYVTAAGDVKGFAFTLGLSTILDLVVVFLFTHPLIAVASRRANFTSGRVSGLGAVRRKPAAAAVTG